MKNVPLIDTHVHLDNAAYDEDKEKVILRIQDAQIEIINVGTDIESTLSSIKLAEDYEWIYASGGIHPHNAKNTSPKDYLKLSTLINSPKVCAIGETGLDYYHDFSPRPVQQEVFRRLISLARETKLPLIIHSRDAWEETLKILKEENAGELGGVCHSFSGDIAQLKEVLEMGFYVSISGMITFKKSNLPDLIKHMPLEKILLETDSPYLTPHPYRGKRNDPTYLKFTAQYVADLLNISYENLCRITVLNTYRLFKIEPGTDGKE